MLHLLDLIIKHAAVNLLKCALATCCTAGTMCQSLFFFLLKNIYSAVVFISSSCVKLPCNKKYSYIRSRHLIEVFSNTFLAFSNHILKARCEEFIEYEERWCTLIWFSRCLLSLQIFNIEKFINLFPNQF